MALYVPAGTRRRRTILIAVAALVVGLAVGLLIGRSTAETPEDRVDDVRAAAGDAATALQRVPIEYEQAVAGEGGESTDTITGAVDRASAQLDDAYDEALWFGPDVSNGTDEAIDAVRAAVIEEVPPAELEALIEDAVAAIEATFGIGS